jgi:uncharacterized protein
MMLTYLLHAFPWDLAIFFLIAGGFCTAFVALNAKLPHGRHLACVLNASRHFRFTVAVLGILMSSIVLYGSFIEPHIITVTERSIDFPADEELTIVVLSDFHVGPYKGKRFVSRVVKNVQEINPDLILLAGDYVYVGADPLNAFVAFKDFSPKYGVFGVLGNHEYRCYRGNVFSNKFYEGFDGSQRVRRALERVGVTMLVNDWKEVQMESGLLYIGGVNDMCTNKDNLQEALPKNERSAPIILLSHDPSVILDNNALYPHLIVSGHTHGGQVRLPFIGHLVTLPTQLGRTFDQGLFPIDKNTTLAITRGIGESGARARLFAPPEILVLHNKKQ